MGHGCHTCGCPNGCECNYSLDGTTLARSGKDRDDGTKATVARPDLRTSLDLVREFHLLYGQPVSDEPMIADSALNELRLDLLYEELDELRDALDDGDAVATLDALTDLQYVLDGAYLSLGFHRVKDAALAEVQRSNLSKLGADGKPVLRADGKVLKGPGFSPPDLAKVLRGIDD